MNPDLRPFLGCVPVALLALAACGGGGSSATPAAANDRPVYVVIDTATGTESLVQFQVAAAVLTRSDGTTTPNLLANPEMVTLADPSGEADALTLGAVPAGDYAALHLMLVPGSGTALQPDGAIVPVQSVVDLTVPIADGLQHANVDSWLVLGHGTAPAPGAGQLAWNPALTARTGSTSQQLVGLRVANVEAMGVAANLACADDGIVRVEFGADCTFGDDNGGMSAGRDDFLRGLGRADELSVSGDLQRDGRCTARHVRRSGGNDGPRLLGRITELRPATSSFLMDVQAEVRRGERRLVSPPVTVLVLAANARLERPDSRTVLAFGDLAVGNLAKVKWTSRTPVAGGPDEVVAREIEVSAFGAPMQPEWEGRVQAVDAAAGTVVVVPRNDDPIVIAGVSVQQVTLAIGAGTFLERRTGSSGDRITIGLADIVPGQDRIWWRGVVTGPSTIDATWVRVRVD
ncbi:MAG: hypothetical protein WAT39_12480 [Planctomycetota bacterium]